MSDIDEFMKSRDTSGFSTAPYVRKVSKPWGWELHFVPDNLPYMGKIEHLNEGQRTSLQAHDKKQESWILLRGNVSVLVELSDGAIHEVKLSKDKGFTIGVGQKHRLLGGEGGGDVLEVSTPEIGITYRLEDDYNRPDETEELRSQRNKNLSDTMK